MPYFRSQASQVAGVSTHCEQWHVAFGLFMQQPADGCAEGVEALASLKRFLSILCLELWHELLGVELEVWG